MQSQPDAYKPKFGLLRVLIGARLMVRGPRGIKHELEVKELRTAPKDAKLVAKCCYRECSGRTWETEEDLVKDHPATSIMARQEETHLHYLAQVDKDGNAVALFAELP